MDPGRPDRATTCHDLLGASQSWLPLEHQRTTGRALGLFNSEQLVSRVSRRIRPRAPLWPWIQGVLTSPGTAEVDDRAPRIRGVRCEARGPVPGLPSRRSRVQILSIPSFTFPKRSGADSRPGTGLSSLRADPKSRLVGVR
jgi:hypothetical protein